MTVTVSAVAVTSKNGNCHNIINLRNLTTEGTECYTEDTGKKEIIEQDDAFLFIFPEFKNNGTRNQIVTRIPLCSLRFFLRVLRGFLFLSL